MTLANLNTRIFPALKHLPFLKAKPVSHSTKVFHTVTFTLQLFKTISGVFSKNNGEGHVKKSS